MVTEPPEPQLDVTVIRSDRRRKTAQARLIGSSVEIRIPAHCSRAEEEDLVRHFRAKFAGRRTVDNEALAARAERLADTYGLPRPDSIRWVSNQRNRWGSCTPAQRSIRLSNRLIDYPDWVIDYVVVHELAHLVEPNHSEAFWALVNAYPLTERARGYLMAKGQEPIDI
ncbi:MAG: M48 family metallopeptidase [Actinomycetota bacterium]